MTLTAKTDKIKRQFSLISIVISILILTGFATSTNKTTTTGYVRSKVMDSGDEGEGSWGWAMSTTFYNGFAHGKGIFSSKAMFLGCKNFTDENSVPHAVKVSGHGQWQTDLQNIMMPVPDADGFTIHKYMRYQPVTISVNGVEINKKFPNDGSDHINPDKIPGTADEMIESWINTDMGITIHQRVLAYSQKNHDQYQIYEWTFTNTGNIDLDEEIELNQTLEDVYFLRLIRPQEEPKGWMSSYGEMSEDTLRLIWGYPQRNWGVLDIFGDPDQLTGFLKKPWYVAESVLFANQNMNDIHTDNPDQPTMTAVRDCDLPIVSHHSGNLTPANINSLYKVMEEGFLTYHLNPDPEIPGSRPGHHSLRFDQRGYRHANEAPWYGYSLAGIYACGPYTLAPGDSFRVVWAQLIGTISSKKAYEIGTAWKAGTADQTWSGPVDDLAEYYPAFANHPDLAPTENDRAKDRWVCTGRDSLFANATAAFWAYHNDYNVPQAPPPPSIDVESLSDRIRISWGSESETAIDFAGYRVYRAQGGWYAHIPFEEQEIVGVWNVIFECGAGTSNPDVVHSYDDVNALPGIKNFYYVAAFDDGVQNLPDFHGKVEVLQSSKFANMTTVGATYGTLRYAGDYTGDLLINYDDLIEFALAWQNQDLSKEIGPATGTPPNLVPQPDGVIDIEDLMVLVQQWNWSFDHPDGMAKPALLQDIKDTYTNSEPLRIDLKLGKHSPKALSELEEINSHLITIKQSDFDPWRETFGDELIIALDTVCNVLGMEIYCELSEGDVRIESYQDCLLNGNYGFTLCGKDDRSDRMLLNTVILEKETQNQSHELLGLRLKYQDADNVTLQLRWRIHDTKGLLISSGSRNLNLQGHSKKPLQYALYQNYPNPFNPKTVIRWQSAVGSDMELSIYNILGQKVATLFSGRQKAGFHKMTWDASGMASGLYFIRLQAHGYDGSKFMKSQKIIVLK